MLASQIVILSRFNNIKPTYQQIKQSIASININYNQLGYTQIKEAQKITAIDLATNIGGTMGLFLGLSFLSFIEIIELLIEIIFVFFEKIYFRFFDLLNGKYEVMQYVVSKVGSYHLIDENIILLETYSGWQ